MSDVEARATIDTPAGFSIRPATDGDVDSVLALVRTCVQHMRFHGIEQWDDLYPDRDTIEEDVHPCEAFVATRRAELIGYVALSPSQDPEYADVPWTYTVGPFVVIHRLMVDPAIQGSGFAKLLMGFAEAHALASGFRTVRLDTFVGNPKALRLYERLGYREAGTIKHRTGRFRCFEKELAPVS